MEAPAIRHRAQDRDASQFGDSVFRSQVMLTGAVALIVCITVGLSQGKLQDSAAFFVGLTAVLWTTVGAAILPWRQFPVRWQMVVPLIDIAAIEMLRLASPQSGFGILLIFPVIWLARSFGRFGTLAGSVFAASLLWLQVLFAQLDILIRTTASTTSPTAAASLSIALAFVAVVTYAAERRVLSQRVLLRRQTLMLEQALSRARVQESTLREAFDAVEFAVISVDRNGATRTTNRATRAMLAELGLPESTPFDRFPLYQADKVTPVRDADFPHVRVLGGATVDSDIYWIGHRTGTRFTISVSGRLLLDDAGAFDRVVLVLRDVSTEVRAISDRDDLVTSMSHELRTPLSSILGYVDLALEDSSLSEETRDMLKIAYSNTERLNTLVNDMLSARSASTSNTIVLNIARCDIAALVKESIDAIRPVAAERIIPISLTGDEGVFAEVDAFRIRQVLDNLLSNAIKYNQIGGRIAVTAHNTEDDGTHPSVEITVTDTGRGMSREEQKGLFERFYRAESVRGSTVHGSGLGLSISRDIVVQHGGTIEVASEPGRGTEVAVTLPRRQSTAHLPVADKPPED